MSLEEYTVFVEYVSETNACEIDAGDELFFLEAETSDAAVGQVVVILAERNISEDSFHIVGVTKGHQLNYDEFWQSVETEAEEVSDRQEQELKEEAWEAYVAKIQDEGTSR